MASYVNAFAFEFHRLLHERSKGSNYVFSPFSLVSALAMGYGGAEGTTAREFEKLLRIESPSDFHQQFSEYVKTIQRIASSENGVTLKSVNRLYVMEGLEINDQYKEFLTTYYDSSVGTFNPADPDGSAELINQFIETSTDGYIDYLIPSTAITPMPVLVILNPVYFKGDWKSHIESAVVVLHPFYLSDGSMVDVDMMASSGLTVAHCYDAQMKAHVLDLADRSGKFVFSIIVPDDSEGIDDAVAALSAEHWNDVVSRMERKKIDLFMPIFEIDSNIGTVDAILQQLGLVDAFQVGRANFRKINGQLECASGILHHARITALDEESVDTVPPASDESSCHSDSESIVLHVNRPFLFIIRELETNSILFMGAMMDLSDSFDCNSDSSCD